MLLDCHTSMSHFFCSGIRPKVPSGSCCTSGTPFFCILALALVFSPSFCRLLYHPDQPPTSRVFVPAPSVVGLPFESVYIKSRDKTRLHAFLIKQPPEKISEVGWGRTEEQFLKEQKVAKVPWLY